MIVCVCTCQVTIIMPKTIYLWLFCYLNHIKIKIDGKEIKHPKTSVSKVGMEKNESLLPYPENVFDGYRIIQEFFFLS